MSLDGYNEVGFTVAFDEIVEGVVAGGSLVRLPFDVPQSGVRLLPGAVGKEGGAAIHAVLRIFDRCGSHLEVAYAVPRLTVDGESCRGVSVRGRRTIAVAVSRGVLDATRTAHHEIWHAVEDDLDVDCVAEVDALVRTGVERPGDYLSSPRERRARLYECWASARDEGWGPAGVNRRPVLFVDRIFDDIYSGRFSAVITAADEAAVTAAKRPKGLLGRFKRVAA